MRKTLLTLLVCVLSVFTAMADGPFRNHRYDAFKPLKVQSDNIVFVGNSITNMHEWWEAFGNHKVLNRGVSGAVSPELLANLEDVLAGHPAKIFFMIGTNDLGTSGLDTPAKVAKNVRTAVRRCVNESPQTKVYVQSILPTDDNRPGKSLASLTATNDSIKKICEEFEGVTYVDLWSDLLSVMQNNTNSLDKLHLSASGYAIWCNKIKELVNGENGTTVYPATGTENSYGGLNGSIGMRNSYFKYYPVKTGDILIIGDETVHGGEWHELLKSEKVKNRGTGWGLNGGSLADIKASLPNIFHSQEKPAQVYLYAGMGGFNEATYKEIVESIKTHAPEAKIYLMSLLNASKTADNEKIKSIADQCGEKVEYLDLYTQMQSLFSNNKYFNGGYVYGLGYVKMAGIMAEKMNLTAITEEEANAQIATLTARNTLANAIGKVDAISVGDKVGQYSAQDVQAAKTAATEANTLLASTTASNEDIQSKATALGTTVTTLMEKINQPEASTADKTVYYRFFNKDRGNLYIASSGAGQALNGITNGYGENVQWKLEKRDDGSFNIINRADGTYINPVASYNNAVTSVATVPTTGWKFSYSNEVGTYIINSGSVELNQTGTAQQNKIYNWSGTQNGQDRDDLGCRYTILYEPTEIPDPTNGLIGTITETSLTGQPIKVDDAIAKKVFEKKSVTVAIDITPTSLSSNGSNILVGSITADKSKYFATILRTANAMGVQYTNTDGGDGWFTQGLTNLNGVRTKFVYVLDEATGSYSLYQNGQLKRNISVSSTAKYGYVPFGTIHNVAATELYIGGVPSSSQNVNSTSGTIHSVRFYNKALTAEEISALTWDNIGTEEPTPTPNPEDNGKFKTTTVTDGQFKADTPWYTMQIGNSGFVLHNTGTEASMSLTGTQTKLEDKDLWCFTGNDTDGYRIYNKEAGAGKVLASPASMTGTTGSTAYVVLKDANALGDYKDLWEFSTSTDLGADMPAFYINVKGQTSWKINNRDNKLAFWTEGADHGSSVQVLFGKQEIPVTTETGTLAVDPNNPGSSFRMTWTSTQTDPQVTLNAGKNNMSTEDKNIVAYVGLTGSQTYNFTTNDPAKYGFGGFRFKAVNASGNSSTLTITSGEQTLKTSTAEQDFNVTGLTSTTADFVLSGENKGVVLKDFFVTVTRLIVAPEPSTIIFGEANEKTVPYRIPGITQAQNGNLIAVADYRYSKADIGMATNGKLDIRGRISKDNGATWGEVFTIATAKGTGGSGPAAFNHAYGDPCIVADRESAKVIMMSCSGNVSFPGGTPENHQDIAYFVSDDNGETWSEPERITDQFYDLLNAGNRGPVKAMFVGSGKIHQSRYTKVGDYYRLFCSTLVRDAQERWVNYVYYSDDFGRVWKLLGDPNIPAVQGGHGNEPKVEELPDGSVLISSRSYGGGNGSFYNVFTFTDSEKGEGTWGNEAFSGQDNHGTFGTSCNGEILLVPAVRASDNKQTWLALRSIPAATDRSKVSIYYKELETLKGDFKDASTFAKDWDGMHRSTTLPSAYSTMWLKQDGHIAFFYEEDLYQISGGYSMVYKDYTIEQLTKGAFTVCMPEDFDADALFRSYGQERVDMLAEAPIYVGQVQTTVGADVENALAAFNAEPTMKNYEALNLAIKNNPMTGGEPIKLISGKKYTLVNKAHSSTYFTVNGTTGFKGAPWADNDSQVFVFTKVDGGLWTIQNAETQAYVGNTVADNQPTPQTTEANAAKFTVVSNTAGESSLTCNAPQVSGHGVLHYAPQLQNQIVGWTTQTDASFWKIALAPGETGISEVVNEVENVKNDAIYDLQGRRVVRPAKGIYIVGGKKMIFK